MTRIGTARAALALAGWLVAAPPSEPANDESDSSATVEPNDPEFYAPQRDLRAYVAMALAESPLLGESLARYRAALERVPRVGALPDPTLSFTQAIRSVETRVGPQLNTISFAQRLPWFGKLDLRGEMVMREALAAHQSHRALQRRVIADVKRAYYELSYIDAALRITRAEHALLNHYEALARARYATGQGLLQAVIKLQAETTRAQSRLDDVRRQRESAVARLNTVMNQPPDATVAAVPEPAIPAVRLEPEELYELGLANRNELEASRERIVESEKAIELAKRDAWPDLVIGLSYVNVGRRSDPAGLKMPPPDDGRNALSLSAGISVPLFREKYDASVREAGERLTAERRRFAHLVNEMEFSIRDQVLRVETLSEQIRLFDDALIPQTEQALSSTESAYETGQLGVVDLLDGERVLLSTRLVRARYRADLLIALSNLERAIGAQFPRVGIQP